MSASSNNGRVRYVTLAILAILIGYCFFPLTTAFFAQDDFVLLLRASTETGDMLNDFFGGAPNQFRPLTKVFYYATMYQIFGLHAMPYHLLSLLIHIVNTILVFALLRHLRVSESAAIVSAALFGLSIAFFNVVAWAACIQQLMAVLFMLVALIYGIGMITKPTARIRWLSIAAYVLSLMSMEQGWAIPIALFLIGRFGLTHHKPNHNTGQCLRLYAGHFVVMALYLVFIVLWKGLPDDGTYAFSVGRNVLANLIAYFGWFYYFWGILPFNITHDTIAFSIAHIPLLLVITYNLTRKRFTEVAFGVGFALLGLLPTLFLSRHTFLLHTYVPAFGMIFLLSLAIDDLFRLRILRRDTMKRALVGLSLLIIFLASTLMVRANIRAFAPGSETILRNFVIRRSLIAKQAQKDLVGKSGDISGVSTIYMVYGRETGRDAAAWNTRNVVAALARGDAIKLFFERPDLNIEWRVAGDPEESVTPGTVRIFYYGDFGHCLLASDAPTEEEPQ